MKNSILSLAGAILLTFTLTPSSAQTYLDMMDNININVFDVIKEAETYFDQAGRGKGSGWKGFERWRHDMLLRFPDGDRSDFDPQQVYKEYMKFQRKYGRNPMAPGGKGKGAAPAGYHWTERGPDNADDVLPTDWNPGVGRVDGLDRDPVDTMRFYLGSRMGGFWKTEDGGTTWKCTTEDLPAMGVVDIEVHPTDHNVIFTLNRNGTGYSLGLMKSTDYGETWDTTSLQFITTNYTVLRDMYISPQYPDTMYIASNDGIYRSFDGGATWTLPYSGNTNKFAIKPFDPSTIYQSDRVHDKNAVRVSYDYGDTWNDVTIAGNSNATAWLATSLDSPNVVYWASNNALVKSSNSGVSFASVGSAPNSLMFFQVLDTDADVMLSGGLDTYRSDDGGANWTQVLEWTCCVGDPDYVHADTREIKSYNGVFWMGSDGYLSKSRDGGVNWVILNERGVSIREWYCIGFSPMRYDHLVGGSQDNGTSVMRNGLWSQWIGADGMECHFDRSNPAIWFGTIQYGALRVTTTDGGNQINISPESNGNWVTPSIIDPSNDNTIFIGYNNLWKSNDNGTTWTKQHDFTALGNDIDYLAIAESDSNVLYAVENKRDSVMRSDDNGLTWKNYFGTLPTGQSVSDIAVHPFDAMTVGVTFSGFNSSNKVFISTDGGDNWSNISSNLPNVPANAIIFEGDDDNRMYVGTDAGVYYYDVTTGGLWIDYNDSLPIIDVRDLEIHRGASRLYAGTYGRGAWHIPLVNKLLTPQVITIDMDPVTVTGPTDKDNVQITARVIDDGTVVDVKLLWGTDAYTFPDTIDMLPLSADSFQTATRIPNQPVGTVVNYKIMAVDNSGDTVFSDKIIYKVTQAVLCTAEGHSGTGSDYIKTVQLNNMSNGPTGLDFYSNYYASQVANLEVDSTYQLYIELNYHWAADSVFAWIDWNDNWNFETNERIDMTMLNGSHESFGTVTVPSTALTGQKVYMRVRNIYTTGTHIADPCNTYSGEVEDYGIYVPSTSVLTALFNYTPNSLCEGEDVTFTDASVGSPTSWNWRFFSLNDTLTSTAQDPVITFNNDGIYSVELIVYDGSSYDTSLATNIITVLALPNVVALASDTIVCDGEQVTLSGSGASTYTWTHGVLNGFAFTPSSTQTYTVTGLAANGCENTDDVTVTVIPLPNVVMDPFATNPVCDFDPAFVLPAATPSGGSYSGPGVSGAMFDPATAGVGTHTIVYDYSDINGCAGQDSQSITVDSCVSGLEALALSNRIRIQPNPSSGRFIVSLDGTFETMQLKITDVQGKEIWNGELEPKGSELDLSGISKGTYYLFLSNEEHQFSKKLLKL